MAYKKVIWISLDAFRADCVSVVKRKLYETEYKVDVKLKRSRVDQLCEKSFVFTNTISAAPYTSASHASYFTGMWPMHHGVYDQFNSRLHATTIFQLAKRYGYTTAFKTDSPFLLGKYLNITKGVDKYFVEENKKILDYIKKKDKIFAFIHFANFHFPYGYHNFEFGGSAYLRKIEELEAKYGLDKNPNFYDRNDRATETFRTGEDLKLLYRYKRILNYLYSNRMDNDLFGLYLEGINYFNEHFLNSFFDRLLEILKDDDYLLMITSDHGEGWNDDTYGHHNSIDEGTLRVLLAFYAKDIKPGVYTNRVRTVDVFPTLTEILFNKRPKCDGETLRPLIYRRVIQPDRFAFASVWVTDLGELARKADSIIKTGTVRPRKNVSSKYSAAAYLDNYKCEVHYMKFQNREDKLVKNTSVQLYKIQSPTRLTETKNKAMERKMLELIERLNKVQEQKGRKKEEMLERYFNALGYKIGNRF